MSAHGVEKDTRTPAQIVAHEYEGYLHSDQLSPAWVAGWHSAIDHAVAVLNKRPIPPAESDRGTS